jgi:formiminotetrahydrofolate cyclodeaminase
LLRLVESLAPITNKFLRSDLAIAAVLGEAAARSAWWNVLVNLALIPDADERGRVQRSSLAMVDDAAERRVRVERACAG